MDVAAPAIHPLLALAEPEDHDSSQVVTGDPLLSQLMPFPGVCEAPTVPSTPHITPQSSVSGPPPPDNTDPDPLIEPLPAMLRYISSPGTVVHTLEEVLKAIGKEEEQAREKEEVAKEAKPGKKRKLEEVFSVQIESAQSQPNPEDISNMNENTLRKGYLRSRKQP